MRRQWIMWAACCMHMVWGIVLLFDASPLQVVPIAAISFDGQYGLAAVLILSSALATAGVFWKDKPGLAQIGMLIPQQLILMISAASAVLVVLTGQTPSGQVLPPGQLAAGLSWTVFLAAWHTTAILDYCFYRGGFIWIR